MCNLILNEINAHARHSDDDNNRVINNPAVRVCN